MKPYWQKMSAVSAFSLALLLSLPSAHSCTANNHLRPTERVVDEVHQAMERRDYEKLDEFYKKYSRDRFATSDGISGLSAFFSGLGQTFHVSCTHPQRTDDEWRAHQASLSEWSKASPTSIAPKLALALFSIDYAWLARGEGTYASVSEGSRQRHDQRMADARQQLQQIAQAGKDNPVWYHAMMSVGLAQGWAPRKFDALYDRAVKLDPYYIDSHYTNMTYHSARWHGSQAQMLKAIDRSTELTRKRLGQTMYARLHWTNGKSAEMFETGVTSWKRMKTGFEDYLHIFSDAYTRNNYATFACMASDKNTLRQQLALLGDQLNQKSWSSKHQFAYCIAYAKLPGDQEPTCFKAQGRDDYFCEETIN
ncbi:hypothetical protein [Massilia antarctica]|uniref:hypothetical protein n=1 Tax=Massilia antarctica TaxID=2765360 RepID=UPI0006BD247C|nr:hypothetical protein [Massilia sp. H27-R4]MCY0910685.1 hypothetical protein [Massilia sp. H27-R4]CUI08942.1 putative cytoplasmic protein [Janthinobacterium sp. CG23_2]CUU32728.1 putative cytoplasmic protein [Janthinobacterium sp. CG23_2]